MTAGRTAAGADVRAPAAAPPRTARREEWRRALHAASGVLGLVALRLPGQGGAWLFGGAVAAAFVLEGLRRSVPAVGRAVAAVGAPLFRPDEARGISGPTTLACGYAAAWMLFAPPVAAAAIGVAALADPAAALVGRRFSRGDGKSLAGSAACALVAAAVLAAVGTGAAAAGAGALVAALVERAPWRGADNLLIPAAVGATLTLLARG